MRARKSREKPGAVGEGRYFRIIVRPRQQFVTFRYHDVGEKNGDLVRLAGKRQSGSWSTQAWLVNKHSAHITDNHLVPDTRDAKELLQQLGSEPKLVKGDIFEAKDRPNVPEKTKPTRTQAQARSHNIAKAQRARWN